MAQFQVQEVQKVTSLMLYTWTVEAENADEALAKCRAGERSELADPEDYGECDYGASGFAVVIDGDEDQAIEDAADALGLWFGVE